MDQAVDLFIWGYFFACQICEIEKNPTPGRTKKYRLRNIVFQTKEKMIILLNPRILGAYYITIKFEVQKNIEKFEKRTTALHKQQITLPCPLFWKDHPKNSTICP